MGTKKDRLAGVAQQLANHNSRQWIQGRGRFVQNEQFRIIHYRLGQPDTLEHASGELTRVAVRVILQSHDFQNLSRPVLKMLSTHPVERAVKTHEPFRSAVVESDALGEKAYTAAGAGMTKTLSEQTASTARRPHKTHREVNCGGLTCAVWS